MTRIITADLPSLLGAISMSTHGVAQQPSPTSIVPQAQQADQGQGQYVVVNDARIFYQVTGSGTPILLIHGFPLSGELFQGQLAGLSSQFR